MMGTTAHEHWEPLYNVNVDDKESIFKMEQR